MNRIFDILFFVFLLTIPQKDPMYNKQGSPSTYGIEQYIKNHQEIIIKEYEHRIDTLYDVYVFTENLSDVEDNNDLGIFYLPDYIIITNEEKFVAYEFKDLSKFKKRTVTYDDNTVKGVIFHELTHVYFNQILVMMRSENLHVSPEYGSIRLFPNPASRFGAEFIEEGVCEYVVQYLEETPELKDIPIPENEEELLSPENKVNNVYRYSVIFLKDFLDSYGLKKGIQILLGNRPPSADEILHPNKYYMRLNIGSTIFQPQTAKN